MPTRLAIAKAWGREHDLCWRCGNSRKALDRCHIIARALGGLDHEFNLALLCHQCHKEDPAFMPSDQVLAIAWFHGAQDMGELPVLLSCCATAWGRSHPEATLEQATCFAARDWGWRSLAQYVEGWRPPTEQPFEDVDVVAFWAGP